MISIKIYLIIGPTGKIYVGQTRHSLERRLAQHKKRHENVYISRAIQAHGLELFKIIELDRCENREEANNKECAYIKKLNSLAPNGYNLTRGGEGGDTFGPASDSEKQRRAAIYGTAMLGKKHTEETKKKMALHMYGEKNPMKRPEVRAKMSANHADFTGSKNPNYGKKHSLETRKKISEANKKRGNKYGFKAGNKFWMKRNDLKKDRKI